MITKDRHKYKSETGLLVGFYTHPNNAKNNLNKFFSAHRTCVGHRHIRCPGFFLIFLEGYSCLGEQQRTKLTQSTNTINQHFV